MVIIKPYKIRLLRDSLKVYAGPGTEYTTVGSLSKWDNSVIMEESEDRYSEKWGRLSSGAGWIILKYVEKID